MVTHIQQGVPSRQVKSLQVQTNKCWHRRARLSKRRQGVISSRVTGLAGKKKKSWMRVWLLSIDIYWGWTWRKAKNYSELKKVDVRVNRYKMVMSKFRPEVNKDPNSSQAPLAGSFKSGRETLKHFHNWFINAYSRLHDLLPRKARNQDPWDSLQLHALKFKEQVFFKLNFW